jgi:hypothetical protein
MTNKSFNPGVHGQDPAPETRLLTFMERDILVNKERSKRKTAPARASRIGYNPREAVLELESHAYIRCEIHRSVHHVSLCKSYKQRFKPCQACNKWLGKEYVGEYVDIYSHLEQNPAERAGDNINHPVKLKTSDDE